MSDINELEKRIAKLEENLNKIVGIFVQASDEKKASAEAAVVTPPHMAMPTAQSSDYLVSDVDDTDDTAMDLSLLMLAADQAKAKKMEIQASFANKVKGE